MLSLHVGKFRLFVCIQSLHVCMFRPFAWMFRPHAGKFDCVAGRLRVRVDLILRHAVMFQFRPDFVAAGTIVVRHLPDRENFRSKLLQPKTYQNHLII